MSQLAADGRLDGRFAAVAGYWMRVFVMCPYLAHRAILDGFCTAGAFADDPDGLSDFGGDINSTGVPLTVPETANGEVLNSGTPVAVVLVIHGADSRAWQCEAADRPECHHRLVIDAVAWSDGAPAAHMPDNDVTAAATQPGEQLVTLYELTATDLNEVDPRLLGQGTGLVWYARVTTGAPDDEGISDGTVRLVSRPSSTALAELPLGVDPTYNPARLLLDTNGSIPDQFGQAHFQITRGGFPIAKGYLDSSLPPFVLEPGDYSLFASGVSGAILASPRPAAECSVDLSLTSGDDVAYYADWPGRGDCTWKEGTWPFR